MNRMNAKIGAMNAKKLIFAFIASCMVSLVLTSCEKDNDISRKYPCRFHFYREMHPTSLIFSSYQSPGAYVYVYTKIVREATGSVRYVYAQSNDGKTPLEYNRIATQVEANVPYLLGANNDIGLIIGCTNFSGPVAYDRICPNCTGYMPLIWAANPQQVTCNNCKRVYDLETRAIVSGAGGSPLMRYLTSLDDKRLNVTN